MPRECQIFPALNQNMGGHKFVNVSKNKTVVTRLVMTQDMGFYEQDAENPLLLYDKCMNYGENSVQK
jgi:hypothetical protein